MVVRSALLLLALAATAVAAADAPGAWECTYENKDGVKYDVSKLMNPSADYKFTSKDEAGNPYTYFVNACRSTVTTTCGPNTACCQEWEPAAGGYAALGLTTTASAQDGQLPEQTKNGGFTVQFTKGSLTTSGQPRQMEIDFICVPDANPPEGAPEYGSEDPPLHYNIVWGTQFACPGQGGGISVGTVILIIFFSLVFVYIVGGCLFMKFVKHAEGAEIFPNVEFWVSVPGLIKDGALFIGSKTCCRDGSYGQV